MNPKEQRIAIAEACGWQRTDHTPMQIEKAWHLDGEKVAYYEDLPDYLSDLNAMQEVIAKWAPDAFDMNNYENKLHNICCPHYTKTAPLYNWCLIHATAAQRAEAFLRTIGKWREST